LEQAIAGVNYEMVIERRLKRKEKRPARLIPMVSMYVSTFLSGAKPEDSNTLKIKGPDNVNIQAQTSIHNRFFTH
jgi:hypothetical protein